MTDLDHGGEAAASVPVVLSYGRHAPDDPGPLGPAPHLEKADRDTRHYRHDGWTPALRATFLETLARSGVVSDACREVQRSSQTAYALRNRDPLFAAGWDTALSMARARLADELYHRAINGTVDQVWKDGAIVAERHHHDNRLSIAVLNRLDARCDRADRVGAPTQRIAAQWDAWLAALGEGRVADAEAMLAPPPPAPALSLLGQGDDAMLMRQFHQLRSGKALDEAAASGPRDEEEDEDEPRVWIQNYTWRTSFPPPLGFVGDEDGDYGDSDYNRQCTPTEWAALDARFPDAFDEQSEPERAADEAIRDAFFAALAEDDEEETGEAGEQEEEETPHPGAHPEPVEGSSETPSDPPHPVPPGPSNDPANPAEAPSEPPHPAADTS